MDNVNKQSRDRKEVGRKTCSPLSSPIFSHRDEGSPSECSHCPWIDADFSVIDLASLNFLSR
jgi:hypothetical protein